MLAAIAPGHLRATKTTVLMRPGTIVDAMKKAGGMEYKGQRSSVIGKATLGLEVLPTLLALADEVIE